ncbi:MAG TPA: hypothetical protein VJ180_01615 [Pyrinomonadaceae bacterium]|nr:hypothetical protein [Pyrinomonadaceae bacterium]
MSNGKHSFGRIALRAPSVATLIDLEHREGRSERFAALDSLIADLLILSLRGERIVTMTENEVYENSVTISTLNSEQREFLSTSFRLEQQQARGAWFVPEKVSLAGGAANFAFFLTQGFRFPHALASLERGKVLLKSSPDAIFLWCVLGPMFEKILYPFELRGPLSGTLSSEEDTAAWREVDVFFDGLGFSELAEMSLLRGKWKELHDASSQLRAKQQFLRALGHVADSSIGTRYRLCNFVPLIDHYYKKAKADGRVKRKQALTKPFQPTLSGFFQGDWLGLLDYMGEQPHSEEQIVTALPKTPLRVRGASRAAEIAATQGIPAEEVQRIAAALWQESAGTSPVEARIATLKKLWQAFDEIHAKQKPGMKPLWGLIEESGFVAFERNSESPYQTGLYRELISKDLIGEIESLWGKVMLTRWPDRMVTEPFPHRLIAETFGPALLFWQSCALTAWFICEGPYSRTDMAGLAHHERRELHELKGLKTPIDEKLFEELIKGESRLGPEEPITKDSSTTEVGYGLSITMSISAGSRRKGFEILRDIVTRHRRNWANEYLDSYLRSRWESEIREAAKAFHLLLGEKGGKAPTLKQFAKAATLATNHWFGGDVSGLYRTIGEKAPVVPTRCALMPTDKAAFVRRVLEGLPSLQFEVYEGRISDDATQDYYRKELAELAIKYVQLEEALGRPPQINEVGEKFTYRSKVLNADESEAWSIFSEAVQKAKTGVHDLGGHLKSGHMWSLQNRPNEKVAGD